MVEYFLEMGVQPSNLLNLYQILILEDIEDASKINVVLFRSYGHPLQLIDNIFHPF